jgi:hypothetical protein
MPDGEPPEKGVADANDECCYRPKDKDEGLRVLDVENKAEIGHASGTDGSSHVG